MLLIGMLGNYFGTSALALATEAGITICTDRLQQSEIDEFLQCLKSPETNQERRVVVFENFAQLCRRRSGKSSGLSEK